MVASLFVTVTANDEAALQKILDAHAPLIHYSQANEPKTLSYEVCLPEPQTQPPSYYVVERYSDAEAINTHMESAVFKTFFAWATANTEALGIKIDMKKSNEAPVSLACKEEGAKSKDGDQHPDGVLVFCGSREGNDPLYAVKAKELGVLMAAQKKHLVYGGGTIGLMGAVAFGCHENGGKVTGIIPRALIPRETAESKPFPYAPIYTDNMATRKSTMFALSGTVISLPGGMGTFDELLEVMTLFQLNAYRPKIGLLNIKGFYDPFIANLDSWIKAGFVNEDAVKYFVMSDEPADLLAKLDAFVPPPSVKKLQWTGKP